MSDLQLRLALRAYDADPGYQTAAAFIAIYRRTHALPTDWITLRQDIGRQLEQENTDFHDQNTLTYDLTMFLPEEEGDEEIYDEVINWVETVASFSHNSHFVWEHIVYLGRLYDHGPHHLADDADPRNFARSRIEGFANEVIPTPEILVPVIERAMRLGAWYIAFNTG